jgi:hypothetical protein
MEIIQIDWTIMNALTILVPSILHWRMPDDWTTQLVASQPCCQADIWMCFLALLSSDKVDEVNKIAIYLISTW